MVAVYIPPLNVSGEDVANVLAAVGEQSDKPLVSSFLGAEGVPELLRVPDVAGSTAGRGSVPSYPAVEAAVRALARGRRVRRVAAHPGRPGRRARRASTRRPPGALRRPAAASTTPTAADLDRDDLRRAAARRTASTCGRPARSRTLRGGDRRPARTSAGTSCSRRPPTTCASGPTWPTCGATSTTRRRCTTPGQTLDADRSTEPETAGFVVQKNAAPGVPVAIAQHGGPAVRAGGVVRRSPGR